MSGLQDTAVLLIQMLLYVVFGLAVISAIIIAIIIVYSTARRFGIEIRLAGRPRKIDAWNEAKSILFLAGFGWLAFITTGFVLNGLFNLGLPLWYFSFAGISIGMSAGFLRHLTGGKPIIRASNSNNHINKRQLASMAPWSIRQQPDGSIQARWFDRRDKPTDEFVFRATKEVYLPADIPESIMFKFLQVALHRHQIAMDPGRTTYKRTGSKLRVHEVLSEQFFCNSRGFVPKLLPEQFKSIWYILAYQDIWQNRRPGHSGNLNVDWGVTPERMVRTVRWGWLTITFTAEKGKKPF